MKRIGIYFVGSIYILIVLLTGYTYRQDNYLFAETSDSLLVEGMSQKEEVLSLLTYVYEMEYYEISNGQRPPEKTFNYHLYSTIPVNLIPPKVALKENLVYRGPCGSKSRLLVALLEATGYDARLRALYGAGYQSLHTIVEVKLTQGWSPLDPTTGAYFLLENGALATTQQVSENEELFQHNIAKFPGYPQLYRYDRVMSFTPFYIIFTGGRVAGLWEFEDSGEVHRDMASIFSAKIIDFQMGTPLLFERPELLPAASFTILGILYLMKRSIAPIYLPSNDSKLLGNKPK